MMQLSRIIVAVFLATAAALAPATDAPERVPAPTGVTSGSGAYLGVGIEALPEALAAHLPDSVPRGQGVLVTAVDPGSPAAQVGVQPYDILLNYDDQRLFSPDQLARMVAADQVGRSVRLQLVRNGETRNLDLTLGQERWPAAAPTPWNRLYHGPAFQRPVPMPDRPPATVQESFESLRVDSLGDDRFKAAIEYLDSNGVKQHHEFEGTRPELQERISGSGELPDAARRHLLDALELGGNQPVREWPVPGFRGPMGFDQLMRSWREGRWPAM